MGICTDTSNSAPPAWREHTTWVQTLVLGGPFAAEVRFGRPAVCPHPAVKAAAYAIVVQESARGYHLRLDRKVARPIYLAEIRRPARSHQCLEAAFPAGAHDLYLEVAAAGGTAPVVRGSARGEGTGVLNIHYWKRPARGRRRRQGSRHRTAILHNQEPIPAQPSPLLWPVRSAGNRANEAMGGALGRGTLVTEISAAHVKGRIHIQLAFVFPDL
jgi:hypothetical protein